MSLPPFAQKFSGFLDIGSLGRFVASFKSLCLFEALLEIFVVSAFFGGPCSEEDAFATSAFKHNATGTKGVSQVTTVLLA